MDYSEGDTVTVTVRGNYHGRTGTVVSVYKGSYTTLVIDGLRDDQVPVMMQADYVEHREA